VFCVVIFDDANDRSGNLAAARSAALSDSFTDISDHA